VTSPDLAYLLGAFLHQDFDIYGDEWGAVDAFISDDPAVARRVPEQIARLLIDFPEEAKVESFADEAGCAYLPPGDGDVYRTWLAHVSSHIAQRLAPN
jgi:hypothetical protein